MLNKFFLQSRHNLNGFAFRGIKMSNKNIPITEAFKESIGKLKNVNQTLDTAFEKSKKYRGEFEESKGGVRPFDHYFDENQQECGHE